MRKLVFCLALAGALVPVAGHAQVTIDMTRVTCAQMLAMPEDQARFTSAWLSGWFNQKLGYAYVDLGEYQQNVASVRQWCATFPGETVMSGLARSNPQRRQP